MSAAQDSDPPPPAPPRRRRRWYQFGLRALFVVMTAVIGLLVAWRSYVEPYRLQRDTMELIKRLGGTFEAREPAAWARWLLGDDLQDITQVNLASCDEVDTFFPSVARLPCVETLILGGPEITDEHLRRLNLPSLRVLVLDSTLATEGGLADFRRRFPDVETCHSERRAIESLGQAFEVASENARHTRLERTIGPQFNVIATAIRLRGSQGPPASLGGWGFPLPPGTAPRPPPQRFEGALVHLRGCRHVWVLDLRGVPAEDADLPNLAPLHDNLAWLYLSGTRVTDEGLANLACLDQLKGLYLGNTQVSDSGLTHLSGLTQLEWLGLSGTRVSDAGLAHLSRLGALKMLWVEGTPVTADGAARLRQSLPNCTIVGP